MASSESLSILLYWDRFLLIFNTRELAIEKHRKNYNY